jgi:maltose alpha-D-glucosyltransferase/alpha-amylase
MQGLNEFPIIGAAPYPLSLGPYGFYWLSFDRRDADAVNGHSVVEITGPLEGAFATNGALRVPLGRFVADQPWFQGRPPRPSQISVIDLIPLTPGEQDTTMWISIIGIDTPAASDQWYVAPVAISFEDDLEIPDESVLARVRRDGVEGFVYDALADSRFRSMLLDGIIAGDTVLGRAGSLICTAGFAALEVEREGVEESTVSTTSRGESYIDFGRGFVIKLFRRIEAGVNPDLELRRFLTERTAFDNVADTYGALEYQSGDTYTLGVLQQLFAEESTAWSAFSGLAGTWLDAVASTEAPPEPPGVVASASEVPDAALPYPDLLEPALELAARLGSTTASLHQALGSFSEDPDLSPDPFTQHYQQSLYQSLRAGVRQELRAIRRLRERAGDDARLALEELIAAERVCLARLGAIRRDRIKGSRIRLHGDYRLEEVHIVEDDFVIEDFSGDHSRPLSERRLRGSPLRDVAQMIRSFDYVALAAALDRSANERAWAAWWSRIVDQAFVTRYLAEMEDSPLLPDSAEAIDDLLAAFAMSRSLRELHWELVTRPDWVRIPLAGIRRMLGQTPSFIG